MGYGLTKGGALVISGGALGIDATAQKGALLAEGKTITVLGSGIDVIYPKQNKDLILETMEKGAVITEYPPHSPADAFHFPQRNRIMAALANAVLVVEGKERSGALITARIAKELDVEVFAVPGPVTQATSKAPNQLIADGAHVAMEAIDVLEQFLDVYGNVIDISASKQKPSYGTGEIYEPKYHNRVGLRYNYALRKLSVTASATYQHTLFDGETTLPSTGHTRRHYHHPLYNMVANLPFNGSNRLRIEARGKTQNPSNNMLQDVVDRSSTSNVRAGNPDVDPAYLHTADIQYINTNRKAGTTFSVAVSYTGSANWFCDSLVINSPGYVVDTDENGNKIVLKEGDQYVKPINLGGYHKMMFRTAFAMPVDLIRCNFNIGAQASLQRLPGMINGDYVPVNRNWFQLAARLDSNISKEIDFTVSYQARYTMNEYTGKIRKDGEYVARKVENNFVSHRALAQLRWVFFKNWTFSGAFLYKKYKSTQGLYDDDFYLCDIFLGHRFLKNRRLEVSIGVNDLLNNNVRSYWHSVNASGRTDGENLGVGRYFSIQCIWHFRAGTKPKKIIQ